jgi:hypothetical protein
MKGNEFVVEPRKCIVIDLPEAFHDAFTLSKKGAFLDRNQAGC